MIIYYRTIVEEDLYKLIRLDKISVALYDLRPRYLAHGLLARILLIFITIIITSSCYNR